MSNPVQAVVVSEGSGSQNPTRAVETLGHHFWNAYAVVYDSSGGSFDSTGFQANVLVSPDGDTWSPMDDGNGNNIVITDSDLSPGLGNYEAATISLPRITMRYITGIVVNSGSDAVADLVLSGSGNANGSGTRPTDRKGPAGNLDLSDDGSPSSVTSPGRQTNAYENVGPP